MKLFIPIILGTARQGRRSEAVAKLIFERLQEREDVETVLFDPRDMDLSENDDGKGLAVRNPDYVDAVKRADALLIVTPEYNHGYPGTLKRILDMCDVEYVRKAVAIVGVSSGGIGGARMIEALVPTLKYLGLVPIQKDLNFFKVKEVFGDSGELLDESYLPRIDALFEELVWMAQALKNAK